MSFALRTTAQSREAAIMVRTSARAAAPVTCVFRDEGHRWSPEELYLLSLRLHNPKIFSGAESGKPHVIAILGEFSVGQIATALDFRSFDRAETLQGLDNSELPFPIDDRVWPVEAL